MIASALNPVQGPFVRRLDDKHAHLRQLRVRLARNGPGGRVHHSTARGLWRRFHRYGCALTILKMIVKIGIANNFVGNVSYVVPGFHGIFAIPADGVNHTPQFTAGAGSLESYKRAMSCAAGMAIVGCRILDDAKFAEQVKADFLKEQ